MEKRPLVSVIMPTYNCGRFIAESVQSVLVQTMPDWELQIVDDASTDDTSDELKPFLETYPQIHYTRLPQNAGPAVARTEAIRRAAGKYIAFLDSDDLWVPEKLEKQIGFMERTGAKFSATAYERMNEGGKPLGVILYPPEKTDYRKMIRLSDPIGNLTVMYDQEALGKYEVPPIQKRNDFALWLQILKDTEYCYGLQEPLARYRLRAGSVSNNKWVLLKYQWQLYHDIEKLGALRSCWGLGCWAFVKGTGIGLKRKKELV